MGRKFKDQAGRVFGRLTVLELVGKSGSNCKWKCRCSCGTEAEVWMSALYSGATNSCGCYNQERRTEIHTKHGMTNGNSELNYLYKAFHAAKGRCTNPSNKKYSIYGGRGIEFRFDSLEQFIEAMGTRPTKMHSVDRIDVNGHYEPSNCRWASRSVQQINHRIRSTNTSGYRGVSKHGNMWRVSITINYKQVIVGSFSSPLEAAKAYDAKAKELHGEYAMLNG